MNRGAPAARMALLPETPVAQRPLDVRIGGEDIPPPLVAANRAEALAATVAATPDGRARDVRRLWTHLGAAGLGAAVAGVFSLYGGLPTEFVPGTEAVAPTASPAPTIAIAATPMTQPPVPQARETPPTIAPLNLAPMAATPGAGIRRPADAAHRATTTQPQTPPGRQAIARPPARDAGGDTFRASSPPTAPAASAAMDSVHISAATRSVDPTLLHAYNAFHADDLAAAEADYAALLAVEPHHADALQGMAALAVRRGHLERAQDYYRQAIAADPANAPAQAALLGLDRNTDALGAESRLKSLLAAQPHQHTVNFALGNIYAAGARWHEAQQQFFHAHTGDVQQPDYLFNLAVSLDHLQQPKLAAGYYRQALAAAARRPAAFDPTQTAARLRELLR